MLRTQGKSGNSKHTTKQLKINLYTKNAWYSLTELLERGISRTPSQRHLSELQYSRRIQNEGYFLNGKCFSTLGREDHSTAIRQTITILSLHNRRRRMEENEEDVLSWPAFQGHCWKRSAFLNGVWILVWALCERNRCVFKLVTFN